MINIKNAPDLFLTLLACKLNKIFRIGFPVGIYNPDFQPASPLSILLEINFFCLAFANYG